MLHSYRNTQADTAFQYPSSRELDCMVEGSRSHQVNPFRPNIIIKSIHESLCGGTYL